MNRELIKNIMSKLLFPIRNEIILFDVFRKAPENQVILNYWSRTVNLGDAISPVVVEFMLKQKGIDSKKKIDKKIHLYAIGSNLTSGIQDCCVWGSGIASVKSCYRLERRKLDVRLVRGPITRMALLDYGYKAPALYGDPGILLPEIYNPEVEKKYKYGVIFHMSEKNRNIFDDDTLFIDISTENFQEFVKNIKSVDKIISSSLHGIILSEAYGIKSVLLKPQNDITKYYDWYYSTKRYSFPIAEDVESAKCIEPVVLPELTEMKRVIKETFPYDLYE